MKMAMASVLLLFLSVFIHSYADEAFDVRQHLSTATRYGVAKDIADNSFIASNIPDGCSPIHLNLVARHGTRCPTKKRIEELDNLGDNMKLLLRARDAEGVAEEHKQKVPAWLRGWQSPWKGNKDGELIREGEEELYHLGIRIRERFPDLFNEEYHHDVFVINATQIHRASASAMAFGMGLFRENGSLGPGNHRAVAVTNENRASDIWLRFFDCCETYKDSKKRIKRDVRNEHKEPIFKQITSALSMRYELNFTTENTSSLWFLCKQEASLLNKTDQACALFNSSEVALLEWTDDLELFMLKGYNNSLNYRMGVPLLKEVLRSMQVAINITEEHAPPGSYEKARLRFAHAETLVPFSCLLGLFLEGSEFEQIQRFEQIQKGQPLQLPLPPKPPQNRNWRGSMVAPFAGNNMLVLYSCPANTSSKQYFVQVLHNEHPIPLPGCNNSYFCPFEVFKERIVAPHLKHDYNTVCNVKLEQPEHKPVTSKLSQLFRWLFSPENDDTQSHEDDL